MQLRSCVSGCSVLCCLFLFLPWVCSSGSWGPKGCENPRGCLLPSLPELACGAPCSARAGLLLAWRWPVRKQEGAGAVPAAGLGRGTRKVGKGIAELWGVRFASPILGRHEVAVPKMWLSTEKCWDLGFPNWNLKSGCKSALLSSSKWHLGVCTLQFGGSCSCRHLGLL